MSSPSRCRIDYNHVASERTAGGPGYLTAGLDGVRLSFLAPDITASVMEGRQPATLTRQMLARMRSGRLWDLNAERISFGLARC